MLSELSTSIDNYHHDMHSLHTWANALLVNDSKELEFSLRWIVLKNRLRMRSSGLWYVEIMESDLVLDNNIVFNGLCKLFWVLIYCMLTKYEFIC